MDGCAHKTRSKKIDRMGRDPEPTAGLLADSGARKEGGGESKTRNEIVRLGKMWQGASTG